MSFDALVMGMGECRGTYVREMQVGLPKYAYEMSVKCIALRACIMLRLACCGLPLIATNGRCVWVWRAAGWRAARVPALMLAVQALHLC